MKESTRMKREGRALCECGCGHYANPGKRFLYGHNRRGRKQTPEHKAALLKSWGKRSHTEESKQAIRAANMGKKLNWETHHFDYVDPERFGYEASKKRNKIKSPKVVRY